MTAAALTPANWTIDAVCAQTDPEVFFPSKGGHGELAKRICLLCPVRNECLADAMADDLDGVWGGTTKKERRRLRNDSAEPCAPLGAPTILEHA